MPLQMQVWKSFSCNNSSSFRLVAEFKTAALAAQMQKEVATFFTKHASAYDKAGQNEEPTKEQQALAQKYGVKWTEALLWGEEALKGDEPTAIAFEQNLVVFHDYCQGFGDLPKVLKKAGAAKVSEDTAPPVLYGELVAPAKLQKDLKTFFAQRDAHPKLTDWKKPSWGKARVLGDADDVEVAFDEGDTCRFTLPMNPANLDAFRAYLTKNGAKKLTLRLATKKDQQSLQAPVAAAKPAKQAAPAAPIPKTKPKVTVVRKPPGLRSGFSPAILATDGKTLWAGSSSSFGASTNGTKFTSQEEDLSLGGILVNGDDIWIAGVPVPKTHLFHSKDGGKKFSPVKIPDGCVALYKIAADEDGSIWVVGANGCLLTSKDRKTFTRVKGPDSSHIQGLVSTPWGVVATNGSGHLFLCRDGKAQKTSMKAGSALHDACVTPSGTLVVVGHGKWKGSVFRSEDEGKTFKPGKLPKTRPLWSIASLPDGRLIAGGEDETLLVSHDDGKSFVALAHDVKNTPHARSFSASVVFKGAVYAGGDFNSLVRIE